VKKFEFFRNVSAARDLFIPGPFITLFHSEILEKAMFRIVIAFAMLAFTSTGLFAQTCACEPYYAATFQVQQPAAYLIPVETPAYPTYCYETAQRAYSLPSSTPYYSQCASVTYVPVLMYVPLSSAAVYPRVTPGNPCPIPAPTRPGSDESNPSRYGVPSKPVPSAPTVYWVRR